MRSEFGLLKFVKQNPRNLRLLSGFQRDYRLFLNDVLSHGAGRVEKVRTCKVGLYDQGGSLVVIGRDLTPVNGSSKPVF